MKLKEIISITGKPGLYRVIAQSGRGFIVEALDDKKTRIPVNANHQVAMLEEITIYTENDENMTLKDVLISMREKSSEINKPEAGADPAQIKHYFSEIMPEYDRDRVYVSDMKKILKWYTILDNNDIIANLGNDNEEENDIATKDGQPEQADN